MIINRPDLNSKYIHGNKIQSRKKGDSGHQKNRIMDFTQLLQIITMIKYYQLQSIQLIMYNLYLQR